MKKTVEFIDENGQERQVTFAVVCAENEMRPFGVRAVMGSGEREESAVASGRFFTREEAEEAVQRLCLYQVTPCTLCDVI